MYKSIITIIVSALVALYMSIFTVQQTERGIILRFGKVVRDSDHKPIVYEPGLHLKIPFIEMV
ncbi:MAG: SPFH domain-containing protein, partial [Arsenophonus sp. NC-QC1-MAG3]